MNNHSIASVLIVDDENFVCENLKLKLNRLSIGLTISADSCNSAKQAKILMGSKQYDLVFTDIRMPFVDGLSFIKSIREQGYAGKILVLSGYDDFDYVRTAFVNGANDYILKPVAITQLEEKMRANLSLGCQNPGDVSPPVKNVIEYAKQYIAEHYMDSALSMSEVAAHISLSYSHFSNLFRRETDTTFPAYLLNTRIQKAIELLQDPYMKVSDICYMVGFKYPQQFSRDFKKITGVYPSEYVSRHGMPRP